MPCKIINDVHCGKGWEEKKGQLKLKKSCFGNVTILMNRKEREREKYKFNELDNFETCIN